jgi:hypothetical protein
LAFLTIFNRELDSFGDATEKDVAVQKLISCDVFTEKHAAVLNPSVKLHPSRLAWDAGPNVPYLVLVWIFFCFVLIFEQVVGKHILDDLVGT